MKRRIMVDLETLGHVPGSVIRTIGAVEFTGGRLGREFFVRIDVEDAVRCGLRMDWSTVRWWMQQSDAARAEMTGGQEDRSEISLGKALNGFTEWLDVRAVDVQTWQPVEAPVEIWGKGASFDNTLLAEAYRLAGIARPWPFWEDRCYRTLQEMRPDILCERTGTGHKALDDARDQARHAIKILEAMGCADWPVPRVISVELQLDVRRFREQMAAAAEEAAAFSAALPDTTEGLLDALGAAGDLRDEIVPPAADGRGGI